MATIILGILVVCLLAMLLMPRQRPPTVIYVRQETGLDGQLGCLPLLILLGVLLILGLGLV